MPTWPSGNTNGTYFRPRPTSRLPIRLDHVLVLRHRLHDPQRLPRVMADRPFLPRAVELVVPALVGAEDRPQPAAVLHPHDVPAVGKFDGNQLGCVHSLL